ncbi:sulfatase-like hydrolase/transferase [Actinoplanes sp. TRM 88003]|uniref:Sulfatase-like hydrolase/transferase n=1 Tax=Paractinoplanes aksuensis TaxID=2939490 RepID=A0ABT1DG04_9ACTN|nr:sulfatase-like hydrolase/transferase [Actinoplanes aksuensis]MCO8269763.1 sulfatase-like hydrolase/transferase [Actinoplanes aksuensis]
MPETPDGPPAVGRVKTFLRHPRVQLTLTVVAAVLLFAALIFPNVLYRLTPLGFLRIPVEGVVILGLLVVLPPRARRVFAVVAGVLVGLLVLEKMLDMGFFEELNRPFDPVLDWVLFDDAFSFAVDSYGRPAAIAAVAAILLLVVGVLALTCWSVLRVGALVGRHRKRSAITAGGVGVAWALTFSLGISVWGAVPVAARSTYTYAWDRANQARAGLRDEANFAREVQQDPFKAVPPAQMLTGLKGKDVIFTFVESYGRSAVEGVALAPAVTPVLDRGTATLAEAGFTARSGWLTSPTFGGGSWLAHATFESGLWINNEQRYRNLVATDRLTLTRAFRNAEYRTVSVMPGATRAWPEGNFYGYDTVWDSRNLGYQGPKFSWSPMPDQYTLKQLNTIEYKKPGRGPLMVEMPLVSSHTPWTPIPEYLPDWNQVGDGSIYHRMVDGGKKPSALWAEPREVRTEYGKSVVYSLTALINWIKLYGDDNLVMVFLGDHQPSPIAAGSGASHDVPITVLAKDPEALRRIASWGWTEGLRPRPDAPVWPMNDFRDKFFAAFGEQAPAS